MRETVEIGTFVVESDSLVISDPCYDRDVWCRGDLPNPQKGKWVALAIVADNKETAGWGKRVAELIAHHIDCKNPTFYDKANFEVGVDSGQAGIFDDKEYVGRPQPHGDEDWYEKCCDLTNPFGVLPGGVVSSSGYGDGGYECTFHRNKDEQISAVRIVFIGTSEEDTEE